MFGGKQNETGSSLGRKFFSSVAILSLSGVLVKVLGLLYKLPLIKILGTLGMGYFNCAYEIYAVISMIATSGVPVAISILVSSEGARGRYGNGQTVYRTALRAFLVIGALGSFFFTTTFIVSSPIYKKEDIFSPCLPS